MTKGNGVKTKIDVAVLQTQMNEVQADITKIKDNHLPHIYASLESIKNRIAYGSGAIGAILIIVEIISLFKK